VAKQVRSQGQEVTTSEHLVVRDHVEARYGADPARGGRHQTNR
jgi:hypothetical protein